MHVVRRRLHMCSSWNVGLAWRAALLPTPCTDPCPDPIRSRQLRLLPLTPPIVVFWLVYGQQTTCFQLQGMQMNLHTMGTELSAATLNVFDSFGIMLFTPLVDQIIYPAFRNRGRELSMFKKIGAGFVFAALSVIAAGIVEIYRRDSGVAFLGNHDKPPQNHLTIWWQAPQYLLVALAEVLTAITTYELFYVTLPPHLRSIGQGLNLLTTALGSLACLGVAAAFSSETPDDLNNGHLEIEFFTIGGIALLAVPLWALVSSFYTVPSFSDEQPA